MAQNKTRELETLTPQTEAALAAGTQATQTRAMSKGRSQKAVSEEQVLASGKGKVAGLAGKRKAGVSAEDEADLRAEVLARAELASSHEAFIQDAFTGEGWQLAQGSSAEGELAGYFSDAGGGQGESVQLAQLELPAIPQGGVSASAAGAASAGGGAAASSLGGMAGIFGAAAGLGLAAGGGGGSQSAGGRTSIAAPTPTDSVSGRLVNGYIKNALVFQDDNGDGVLNNDKDGIDEAGEEPYTHTDANGNFKLEGASAAGGPLIAQPDPDRGTEDTSTGLAVTNVFKAPAKATVISPLSTLLEAGAASGLTEQQLKTAFGIDAAKPLLDFNPVSQALSSDPAEAAIARKFKAVNVMVSNLMDVGNSLIGGAKGQLQTDFSEAVVSSLVDTVKSTSGALNLGTGSVVESILTKAAQAASVSPTALSAVITGAANQLSEANGSLLTAAQASYSDPADALIAMAKIEKVVQSDVSGAVQSAAASPSNASAVAALTGLDLQQKVDQVSVPEPLIFETLGFEAAQGVVSASINGAGVTAPQLTDGNTVIKVTKPAGAADLYNASGVSLSTGTHKVGATDLPTLAPLDLISGNKLGMWVHSARAGTTVTLEVGDSDRGGWPNDGNFVAARAITTKAGWEYLGFDFSKPVERYVQEGNPNGAVAEATEVASGVTYDMLNVFFDLGQAKSATQTYYFDKLGYFTDTPGAAPADIAIDLAPAIPTGYTLSWSDEFGGDLASVANAPKSPVDSVKWGKDLGAGGWGNGESQTYTDSIANAYTQNGALYIAADKTGTSITSARLKSVPDVGPNAYVEVRAKVPVGQGAWPAAWLLGQGQWPDSGEIDIMEWSSAYFNPSQTQSALHFLGQGNPKNDPSAWTSGDTQKKGITTLGTPVTEFHTYQVWWTQDAIRFGVDANSDNAYYTYTKPANPTSANWPFTGPMDLILNLAIGGNLGGVVPSGDFHYEMVVDYVRVYQGASAPTAAAPAPSGVSDAEAISLYSDAFTDDQIVTNFNPGWGQSGSLAAASDVGSSVGNVLKFTNLNYQGIELNKVDVSQKQSLHVDLWSATAGKVKLFLVSNAGGTVSESGILLDVTAGSWNSFDIDLDAFPGTSLSNVFQMKFDSQVGAIGQDQTALTNFYMDNLYFSNRTPTVGTPAPATAPTAAAPAPSGVSDAEAISLYSDAFTDDQIVTNFNPGWGQSGSLAAASDVGSSVGNVLKFTNLNYQGIELNKVDVSQKQSLHVDLWSATAGKVKLFLVSNAGGTVSESGILLDVTAGSWNSFDIDLDAFPGTSLSNVFQMKFDSQVGAIGQDQTALTNFYMDNLYFSNRTPTVGTPAPATAPTAAAPAPSGVSDAEAISLYSDAFTDDQIVTNFNPGWGQSGSLAAASDVGSSVGNVLKFTNLNYQGIELNKVDVSQKQSLHVDLWSATAGKVKLFLVSNAGGTVSESGILLDVTAGSWNSFDIDLDAFPGTSLSNVFQMKFDSQVGAIGQDQTALTNFYMDNLYFSNRTPTVGTPAPATAPTAAAPAPSGVSDAEAISLYSDAFTDDQIVTNFNPGWGQSGSLAAASDVGSSVGNVLKFTNLNYQGIELNKVDVSQKQSLHVDLWSATAGKVKLFLVSNAGGTVSESGILLDVTAGSWNSFDIDLDAFPGTSLSNVFQMKFDSQVGAIGQDQTALTNFYMDNLYFSNRTPTVGTPAPATAPTAAAPAPSGVSDAEAISLYSDAFTDDQIVTNFNPGWGQSGSLAAASDVGSSVGNVLKFTNLNYQGIELNKVDVSQKQSLHVDLWSATAGKVKLFLVSNAGGTVSESGILLDVTAGSWNSFDIDLDAFPGTSLSNVFQMKFDSQVGAIGQDQTALTNFYMDNLYFSDTQPVL